MTPIDLSAIGFIVIAGAMGARGGGFRWLKRLAGLVAGALAGGLLLGAVGLACFAWSPPDSSVNTAFRESQVLRAVTSETASIGRTLGIDMAKFRVGEYRGGDP